MKLYIYSTCDTTKNFFIKPYQLSENPYKKITAVVASIFVGYITSGAIHLTVGVSYLSYKIITYFYHSNTGIAESKNTLPTIIKTAVQDDKVKQNFKLKSPWNVVDHPQEVNTNLNRSNYSSSNCVNFPCSNADSTVIEVTKITIPQIIITPPPESKTPLIRKTKSFIFKEEIIEDIQKKEKPRFEQDLEKKNSIKNLTEKELSIKKTKEAEELTINEKKNHLQNITIKFQKHIQEIEEKHKNSTHQNELAIRNIKANILNENGSHQMQIENLDKIHKEKIDELEKINSLEINIFEEQNSRKIERQEEILNEEKNMLEYLYRDAPLTLKQALEGLENSKNELFNDDAELLELIPSTIRSENEIKKYTTLIEIENKNHEQTRCELEQKHLNKLQCHEKTIKMHDKNFQEITLNYQTEKNLLEKRQKETITNLENEIKHLEVYKEMVERRYEKTTQEIKKVESKNNENKNTTSIWKKTVEFV